jgi:RNA polymerase sigma factor (sigma-70 family)
MPEEKPNKEPPSTVRFLVGNKWVDAGTHREKPRTLELYQPREDWSHYASRVATNAMRDVARRARIRLMGSLDEPAEGDGSPIVEIMPSPLPGPDVLAEGAETFRRVERILTRLPKMQQQTIAETMLGHEMAEIAAKLGYTVGTGRTHLHRGRNRITEALTP